MLDLSVGHLDDTLKALELRLNDQPDQLAAGSWTMAVRRCASSGPGQPPLQRITLGAADVQRPDLATSGPWVL